MQREIKDYFYFSKNEKRGIFLLCLLMILTFFIPAVFSLIVGTEPEDAVVRQLEARIVCFPGEELSQEDSVQEPRRHYPLAERKNRKNFQKASEPDFIIELNTADSLDLLSIPGIGPYFSMKILNYREKLGGYFTIGQLLEVKGMDKEKLKKMKPYFRVDTSMVRRIPINSVDFKVLLKHPYSNYQVAKSLIKFRQSYGTIVDLEELHKSNLMPDSLFLRLKPYLSLQ